MKKLVLLPLLLLSFMAFANVSLPKIFSDNMVLQRNKPIPVWGWAGANEKIWVQFNNQTKTIKADKNGKWMIKLNAENAGGPYSLTVKGKNIITLNNVLVGEVWICSGQSNMEFNVKEAIDADKDIATANYPLIHHFAVPKDVSAIPKNDISGGDWKVCSPETVGNFTAVGFFFARELYNELHIPIGLIHTSWGGTHSETWTSRNAFEKSDEFKNMIRDMPYLNLDSLGKVKTAIMMKKITYIPGAFDKNADAFLWKDYSYDDSKWPKMKLPVLWEDMGLEGLDGVIWFRKSIEVSAIDAGKAASIELSMIDDNDITYVNGIKVGSTSVYNEKRKYNIPAGVLKAGKNTIAVRVEDTGGGGGIYGEPGAMKILFETTLQPLAGEWMYKIESVLQGNGSVGPNDYPTLLFNAMLNPLIPYTIEGAIWYQGESNAGRAYQYRKAFPLMITDWRQHWNQGDFPFYFVQLASFNSDNGNSKKGSNWAELREAQTMTLSLPNTGMAVTTDIGTGNDIHPKNKQDVGKRLAAIALHKVYEKNLEYSGPLYQSMKIESNKIIVSFTHTGSGLMVKDKYGYVKGFEIAEADQQFHYAKAMIEGNQVVVYSDVVSNPVALRFGWADDAGENNLFNKEGFLASPFRTDSWKGITEERRFSIK
jgi:sialate O-acetylesterase